MVARAGVSGPAWLEVWLPALLEDRGVDRSRVAPMANARELLGLVVAERRPGGEPFGELDERVLADSPGRSASLCTTSGSTRSSRRRSTR